MCWPLVPFSYLFSSITFIRKHFYLFLNRFRAKPPVPIIIIGNLTVGGTGKTPLVLHVAKLLHRQGYKPGILCSGYRGSAKQPTRVSVESDPSVVGDEPLLLALQSNCPVYAYRKRRQSLKALLDNEDVNIVICDDGLQHYALPRDIEIVVVDGIRRFGNGYCLPAGPLREPARRLQSVDLVMVRDGENTPGEEHMHYRLAGLYHPHTKSIERSFSLLKGKKMHAIAGIGDPERFFATLRAEELQILEHPYPDHHPFQADEVCFEDGLSVIMTEKDFVKCRSFVDERHWVVRIQTDVSESFDRKLMKLVKEIPYGA